MYKYKVHDTNNHNLKMQVSLHLGILSILNDNEKIVSIWSNHNLVLLGPDPEEGEIVGGIEFLEHVLGLVHEVVEEPAILDGGGVVEGGLDGHSLVVDHDAPDHAFVRDQALQCFLHFGCHPFLEHLF